MDTLSAATPVDLVRFMLPRCDAGWSIGCDVAVADFLQVEGDPDPAVTLTSAGGTIVTPRGAVRLDVPPEGRVVAYETPSRADGWIQAAAFCLPAGRSAMAGRTVLTELGDDAEAVRPEDRDARLFDLGVGAANVDFCIRTRDPDLIAVLRAGAGRAVAFADGPEVRAVKAAAPHRIGCCRFGRIEVYQAIGSRRRDIPTPLGPHTHVLPPVHPGQTPDPASPLPDGWSSALTLYPASPLVDRRGRRKPFDPDLHRAFQTLLERFAPPGYMEEKVLVTTAVLAGMDPAHFALPDHPLAHQAARVALRQLLHTSPETEAVHDWLALFEPANPADPMPPRNH